MLTLLFIVLYMALFAYKATHYAKDDFVDLPTNSKSGTQKIKEFADNASQSVANSGKTAKNLMNRILAVLSSMFWWSVLFGVVYLILEFGISIYQGASEFMSDSSTPTSTPIPLNRIVDGDYVPDKTDGTYLFTIKHNKSYRIKVSGCNLMMLIDGIEYNTTPYISGNCSDGTDPRYNKKYHFKKTLSKGAISPNNYYAIAILVIKKDGKIVKKLPIGGNLYTINSAEFPNNSKAYLYVNLSIHETVESGYWHVVVDEI